MQSNIRSASTKALTGKHFMDIGKVDLSGVEPGTRGWDEARAAVTASLVAHGCVVIAHDALSPELQRPLFDRTMPEIFALPVETRQRNVSSKGKFRGYLGTGNWDSVSVDEPTEEGNINDFTGLFWPQGNPEFRDVMLQFGRNLLKLKETVEKMVLESLGVQEENIESHLRSLSHTLRLTHYGALPEDADNRLSMRVHTDFNLSTMVVQHEVEGLEVQTKDGSWLFIQPEPGTVTYQAGEILRVVTNGRVPACVHRVRTPSNRERFVVVFGCWSREGAVVSAMDELIDADHPQMYNPCRADEFVEFLYSEEGRKCDGDPLKAFCGVARA
ncbi:hypothetical protein EJB05_30391, partial [Eragrostis curvula]